MNRDMEEVIGRYKEALSGIKAVKTGTPEQRARYYVEQIDREIGVTPEAFRMLGWAQCIMEACGIFTAKQLKSHTGSFSNSGALLDVHIVCATAHLVCKAKKKGLLTFEREVEIPIELCQSGNEVVFRPFFANDSLDRNDVAVRFIIDDVAWSSDPPRGVLAVFEPISVAPDITDEQLALLLSTFTQSGWTTEGDIKAVIRDWKAEPDTN